MAKNSIGTAAGSVSLSDGVLKLAIVGVLGLLGYALFNVAGLLNRSADAVGSTAGGAFDFGGDVAEGLAGEAAETYDGAQGFVGDGADWWLGGGADTVENTADWWIGGGADHLERASDSAGDAVSWFDGLQEGPLW
ncbi:hypothetical protein [Halomarina oriensis]|uniref:Uncharacterized protein n=1 Tax=Halomarina oriensis TaxID=671145 RepID=A0A6B0GXT7_9EURY|nr:hypothetical protein [Halomarina oriensis]MWG36955.1 hypothetical protein [Halomarina oriensis]